MKTRIIAAYNNDDYIRYNSSSGGVFSAIANHIIENNGYVFAAYGRIDKNGEYICEHIECNDKEELEKVRKSKYIASKHYIVYKRIKELLELNKNVLFVGSTCQVSGLLTFLGKKYDNLLTVDFICHGVPSSKIINKILEENKNVQNVDFRDKETGWENYSFSLELKNGKKISKKGLDSNFMKLYLTDMYLKQSCYNCQFKGVERNTDITLGDFWQVTDYIAFDKKELEKGISVVLIHSENGNKIINDNKDKMAIFDVDKNIFETSNIYAVTSVIKPYNRKKFVKLISKKSSQEIISYYNKNKKIGEIYKKVYRKLKPSRNSKNTSKELPDMKMCTGCMACKEICPFNAIEIQKDELGFEYPKIIKEKCKNCNLCKKVCPILTDKK